MCPLHVLLEQLVLGIARWFLTIYHLQDSNTMYNFYTQLVNK